MSAERSVIVTGGTGGLGRALVEGFLEAGDRVVVPWRAEAGSQALRELHPVAAERGALLLVEADVTRPPDARALADAAGGADVLVNGVGGFDGGPRVEETELEVWERLWRLNVMTAVCMSRAVLPAMRSRGSGVVVNVASQAAFERPPGLGPYSATKAALVSLTTTLQNEAEGTGIRACAVAPGTLDTPANRAAMPDADPSAWTPPGRVASVVRWLASEEASTVRGAVIPV